MSASSSSSSPSSSSSSEGGGGDGRRYGGDDFPGPSSSRPRFSNEVWPEPFVEALATQVAIDAWINFGRLAAAPALANLFQVCSTWRAISRSELLWHNLTRQIWNRTNLTHPTWRDEFIFRHRTSLNFQNCQYHHTLLHFDPFDNAATSSSSAAEMDPDALTCRCLALSDLHLAAGFSDGAVRLFHLPTRLHVTTLRPHPRPRLGRFSPAVSGIVISHHGTRLVFATLDGDIHATIIHVNNNMHLRRAHAGDVVRDGTLADFTGCNHWWVGLFAGVPERAFHIWDSQSEELLFVGGTLTDPEAVIGWHLLTEFTDIIGRVRVTSRETAIACTSQRLIVFDLTNQGLILGESEPRRGIMVGTLDTAGEVYLTVDARGLATVRRVDDMSEVCRINVRGVPQRGLRGCMNSGYVFLCSGGAVRVWEAERGGQLYSFVERIGDANAMVADERHVAACCSDSTIHLWDFSAE